MLQNYFKIAFRNLVKERTYSFINLAGLAVGLATCMIIALYVLDDLSFDNHQPKADRIGLFQQFLNSSSSGSSFGDLLKKQTGIEAVAQVSPQRALVSRRELGRLTRAAFVWLTAPLPDLRFSDGGRQSTAGTDPAQSGGNFPAHGHQIFCEHATVAKPSTCRYRARLPSPWSG